METVSIDDAESGVSGGEVVRRELTDSLGAADVAINRYHLDPGTRISGLHAHTDQEEVFVVTDGELTFETLPARSPGDRESSTTASEGREIVVGAGEAVRFAPGEFQSGKNDSDAETAVLALGAPRDSEDVRVPVTCPECGHGDTRPTVAENGEKPVLVCPDCGGESAVECPECGRADLRAVLGEDGVVSVCRNCGAESEA